LERTEEIFRLVEELDKNYEKLCAVKKTLRQRRFTTIREVEIFGNVIRELEESIGRIYYRLNILYNLHN